LVDKGNIVSVLTNKMEVSMSLYFYFSVDKGYGF